MKKAIIITPFDNYSYQVRIKYVERYLTGSGYDVKVISSDFDHRNKKEYSAKRDNLVLVHVPTYKKNLSYARIKSHKIFAKETLKLLCTMNPDLVYCSAPPNYLFRYTSQYKKKHPEIKLLFELGDLWPETLPLQGITKWFAAPVLQMWAGIRDKNIKYADGIIYECQMFSDLVSKAHPGVHSEVIYLSKEDYYKGSFSFSDIPVEPLRFAYVGSINNIIDIDLIVEIIKQVAKRRAAELVVIGGGENADSFFQLCEEVGVHFENHGIVYDDEEKHKILSSCHFGLNIMKEGVAVGATMKSLEYFHEGLVLINNIPADSEILIDDYKCGFNINKIGTEELVNALSEIDGIEINKKRRKSRQVYEELFNPKSTFLQFDRLFLSVGVKV